MFKSPPSSPTFQFSPTITSTATEFISRHYHQQQQQQQQQHQYINNYLKSDVELGLKSSIMTIHQLMENSNVVNNKYLDFYTTINTTSTNTYETFNSVLFLTNSTTTTTAITQPNGSSSYNSVVVDSSNLSTIVTTTINATLNHHEIEIKDIYENLFSWQGICLIIVFCAFIVITIIGNTLVILAVITTRRLRTVTNCFVMSLAVADLLVGIFVMPPAVAVHLVGSWQLGWVLCDIWISLDVLLCTASILSLCAISIDRYLAVTQPLTYSRKRRSKRLALIMILIVWCLALAITCPPMLGWYEPGRRDLLECRYNQNEGYVIFSAMGSFFIPMAVMIYVYARISCVVASRHDNMTDIGIHNKKCTRYQNTDTEAEIDLDISEHENQSPGHKKHAARTLSNQTLSCKDIQEITVDDNGDIRQSRNGSYELITSSSSRTPSFKRQPSIGTKISTTSSIEHWSFGNRHSIRHHHNHHHHHHHHHHHNSGGTITCGGSGNGTGGGGSGGNAICNEVYITKNTRVHQKSLSNRITSLKKENKTTQTLSIVVGGFIACWLPFFIYYLITPFLSEESVSRPLAKFLTWLGWFNSAINPFIYAFYSVDFRAAFWRLTLKRFFKNSTKAPFSNNMMSIRR